MSIKNIDQWMWQVECGAVGVLPRYYYQPRWNNGWPVKVAFLGQHGKTDWWWRPVHNWEYPQTVPYVAAFVGRLGNHLWVQNSADYPEAIATAALAAGLPARRTLVSRYELTKLAKAGKLKYAYEWGREKVML